MLFGGGCLKHSEVLRLIDELSVGYSKAVKAFQASGLPGWRGEQGPGPLCPASTSMSYSSLFTLSVFSLVGLGFPIYSLGGVRRARSRLYRNCCGLVIRHGRQGLLWIAWSLGPALLGTLAPSFWTTPWSGVAS